MSHDKREFSSWWTETNQKQRTMQALVAAKALVANGRPVTIADVAEAAQVSVATAYRYFSNPNDLVLEAATPRVPQIMADLPDDPADTSRTPSGPGTPPRGALPATPGEPKRSFPFRALCNEPVVAGFEHWKVGGRAPACRAGGRRVRTSWMRSSSSRARQNPRQSRAVSRQRARKSPLSVIVRQSSGRPWPRSGLNRPESWSSSGFAGSPV
jgi:AcrR family transcriptional regulator